MRSPTSIPSFRLSFVSGCCLAGFALLVACSPAKTPQQGPLAPGVTPAGPGEPGAPSGGADEILNIKWEKAATIKAAGVIAVEALTTEECCTGDDPVETAPARFFMGNHKGEPFGLLAYLGPDDLLVVAAMTGGGAPPSTIWTSTKPAERTETTVILAIPVEVVPGGILKLWAGRGAPLQIDGKALPEQTADGAEPFVLLDTGRPEGAAGAAPVTAEPSTPAEGGPGEPGGPGEAPPTEAEAPGEPSPDQPAPPAEQ